MKYMCSRSRWPPAENGWYRMAEAASRAGRTTARSCSISRLTRYLMAVDVNTSGGTFQLGVPKALFHAPVLGGTGGGPNSSWRWDISRDGKRFLINTSLDDTASSPITVLLNWQSAMR